jgi:hypothetical protein
MHRDLHASSLVSRQRPLSALFSDWVRVALYFKQGVLYRAVYFYQGVLCRAFLSHESESPQAALI